MQLEAIFFDIDGTLVDSNALHVQAWAEAFQAVGFPIEPALIRGQVGKGGDLLVPALLGDADAESQDAARKRHGEIYQGQLIHKARPFPGARDLLRRVHASGHKVVLASSAEGPEIGHYLDLLDCRAWVDATTGADDVQHSKPAPDIFAAALEKVAPLGPDQVLVVGDTPYDVQAARRCGIRTVAVRSGGFPDKALTDAGAVALYDDVQQILAQYDTSPLAR